MFTKDPTAGVQPTPTPPRQEEGYISSHYLERGGAQWRMDF